MGIKHLVLSGGAYKGIYGISILRELFESGFLINDELENIYAASIGTVIGVLICLKNDFKDIEDYFVNRPWGKVKDKLLAKSSLTDIYSKKGFLNKSIFELFINSFIKINNLKKDITLKELYEYSKITLHIHSVKLNEYKLVKINHMTHPELKVIDAIYMSSSIPIVFQPHFYEGSYYIDSGFLNSYPVNICLDDNHNMDEIFGITYEPGDNKMVITEDDSVFSFVNCIFRNMIDNNDVSKKYIDKLKYEIVVILDDINRHDAINMMVRKEKREESVSEGKTYAREFLERIQFEKNTTEQSVDDTKQPAGEARL